MAGYTRVDTSNNIADGNVISAADLDNEFDGVQAAFNASTGHTHGGGVGEGAPITALGPVNDVTISATLFAPKTTNTVDIGSSSLKYKNLYLAGNASIAGTLGVTGVATFTAQPVLSSLTASRAVFTDGSKGLVSNAITGTGNVVMSNSPTLVAPVLGTPASGTVTNLTGTASININGTVGATTANTGSFTTMKASTGAAVGGATPGAGGLAFPATAVAVADANTLDDYEEGTWTPALAFGGGTTGITYAGQGGYYTKVGRVVTLTGGINLSSKGSATGAATITGLPFPTKSGPPYLDPGTSGVISNSGNLTTLTGIFLFADHTSSSVDLKTGANANFTDTSFANNTVLYGISLTYQTN